MVHERVDRILSSTGSRLMRNSNTKLTRSKEILDRIADLDEYNRGALAQDDMRNSNVRRKGNGAVGIDQRTGETIKITTKMHKNLKIECENVKCVSHKSFSSIRLWEEKCDSLKTEVEKLKMSAKCGESIEPTISTKTSRKEKTKTISSGKK